MQEDTEWFRVIAWERLAEVCNDYLTKGRRVYVEGRLQTRKWQDKEGQDRYTTEVIASEIMLLDTNRAEAASAESFDATDDLGHGASPSSSPAGRVPAAPGSQANKSRDASHRTTAPLRTTPRTGAFPEEDLPF